MDSDFTKHYSAQISVSSSVTYQLGNPLASLEGAWEMRGKSDQVIT
jgi:hypothetical protein